MTSYAGFLTVSTSTIYRNASAPGDGIHYDHGSMNVSSSTVSGSSAPISGGGVFNFGTIGMAGLGAATIVGSTISDHAAAQEEMTSAQAIAVDRPEAQQIERARSPIRDGVSSREKTETATFNR